MSKLIDHAKTELALAGLFDPDSDYDGELGRAVLELVETLAQQGHSGASAQTTVALFAKLARQEPLSPLKSDPAEWEQLADGLWQNRRDSRAFSRDGGQSWERV